MSALFNFNSFLTVVLLVICTCTFVKMQFPTILHQKTGFRGFFWKAARIGERLSPWVAAGCLTMVTAQSLCLSNGQSKEERLIPWTPPPEGWIKINTDGASKASSHDASAGGLIRNSCGQWLRGFMVNIGRCSAITAELWGLLYGLQMGWRLGFRRVFVEMDSKLAIEMSKQDDLPGSSNYGILAAVKELLKRNWSVNLRHSYREGNACADRLANLALRAPKGFYDLPRPPEELCELLFQDLIG